MTATLIRRWRLATTVVAASLCAAAPYAFSTPTRQAQPTAADHQTIVHVLDRLGYGPRPGDVDRVARLDVSAYIEEQLHPERMASPVVQPAKAPREPQTEREKDQQMLQELMQVKVLRALSSERQLEEVLVDFWFNHFNVFAGKGQVRAYLPAYERDAIRPHVLGNFRSMLGAVAESPAMLSYLDNVQNVDPKAAQRQAAQMEAARNRPMARARQRQMTDDEREQQEQRMLQIRNRGLNENYARELMELHTLGVDGGYTQADVVAVARAFTGWGVNRPAGTFQFNAQLHDNDPKTVLGHTIKGGGRQDAEAVLDLLATHPSTARFIATKLARRFVADEPPPALVERVAKVFLDTKGDLRAVTRAVITSPEFFAAECQRAKVKTPLEFVISAMRTTGRSVPAPRVVQMLRELGMPVYGAQPPTGWGDTARDWISTGALIKRMNVAGTIARGNQELALSLGSPEFQRK